MGAEFLSKFYLDLPMILNILVVYFADRKYSSVRIHNELTYRRHAKISKNSVNKVLLEARILITKHLRDNERYFKPGSKIAIDESHFLTEKTGELHWVFGMIDINDENHAIVIEVPNRKRKTLS